MLFTQNNGSRIGRALVLIVIALMIGGSVAGILVGIQVGYYDAALKYYLDLLFS